MTDAEKIKKLKEAIQKLLNGINFALDENFGRKVISSRLIECRKEAIKILKENDSPAKYKNESYYVLQIDDSWKEIAKEDVKKHLDYGSIVKFGKQLNEGVKK